MAGRRSFAELRARVTPEARAKAEAEAVRLDEEMHLAEVLRPTDHLVSIKNFADLNEKE